MSVHHTSQLDEQELIEFAKYSKERHDAMPRAQYYTQDWDKIDCAYCLSNKPKTTVIEKKSKPIKRNTNTRG